MIKAICETPLFQFVAKSSPRIIPSSYSDKKEMSSRFLDLSGDTILQEQVLGCGSSAVVVLRDGLAVKTPLRYIWSSDIDRYRGSDEY